MKSLLKLSSLLKPYWLHMSGAFILLAGATATQLVVPSIIRNVIDTGLMQGEPRYMLQSALIILAIGVGRALLLIVQRYMRETVSMSFSYDLRNKLFRTIQKQSFSYHDHAQTGQLMSRCTEDVRSIQAFVGQGLLEGAQVIMLLVGATILMFNENVKLSLITLSPMVPLLILTLSFGRKIGGLFYNIDKNLGDLSARLQENVTGVQVVRAFTREDHEINRFEQSNQSLYDSRINVMNVFSRVMPTTMFLVSLSSIALLWFGGNMVLNGTMSVGQIVEFNSYVVLIALPARQLAWNVNIAGEASAGAQRVMEVLKHEPEIQSPENAYHPETLRGEVKFDNVSFTYKGEDLPALHNIEFETPSDRVIGLIGPTGSGKTTFINLMSRFYDVSAGKVLIDGVDVRDYDVNYLRSQIGLVLQTTLLFSSNIHDNIAFGRPDATREEVIAAAKAAKAHDFIESFPKGYDTVVGERGITLSGGQRQRVAIARALLIDPRILVLDDSTASVDTETEYAIQQALRQQMKGRTTFIITQRISSIREADLILVFEEGKIVERGTHQELLDQGGVYTRIHTLQHAQQEQAIQDLESSANNPKEEGSNG